MAGRNGAARDVKGGAQYSVTMSFHSIKLPPVTDILILGKKFPHGKIGVSEAFKLIAPDEFDMYEINEESDIIEAVLINRMILKRMPAEKVIDILRQKVFPYVSKGEAIKVDFTVTMSFDNIQGEL